MLNPLAIINDKQENEMILGKVPTNEIEEAIIFNAMNGEGEKISSVIGKQLDIYNFYIQNVAITDTLTNEISIIPRCVLITPDGDCYSACSSGLFNSLSRLSACYGLPSEWNNPITVEIKQRETKNGRTFILSIVSTNGNHFKITK